MSDDWDDEDKPLLDPFTQHPDKATDETYQGFGGPETWGGVVAGISTGHLPMDGTVYVGDGCRVAPCGEFTSDDDEDEDEE